MPQPLSLIETLHLTLVLAPTLVMILSVTLTPTSNLVLGLTIALIGICGEILSDHQLSTFVENRTDPNAICKTGLWRYSRHPNYFFEMVIWIGVYLFACGSAFGWATLHAPVIITYLLLKVTGIPPSEASSLKKKGDRYRQYQRTTSPFIPLPPKSP